jgi:hypothetical protein
MLKGKQEFPMRVCRKRLVPLYGNTPYRHTAEQKHRKHLEEYSFCRSAEADYGVEIALAAYRQDRESMESGDADGSYRNRLLSGYLYARQQKAESSSSCIHRHSDCNADKRADFSFHTSDLITGKVERLLQILIAEMRLAIYATGRIGDIEIFATQLIQVWCLGGLVRGLCSLHVCLLLLMD